MPGVFAGVGVFLAFELLAVFEHAAAKSDVIKRATKANGRPILILFVFILCKLKSLILLHEYGFPRQKVYAKHQELPRPLQRCPRHPSRIAQAKPLDRRA